MLVKISSRSRLTIPAELRRKYALKPGTELQIIDYGGVLALIPVFDDPIEAAAGLLSEGDSLTQALLAEHRREVDARVE